MNKKDFRVQLPLWNIALLIILIIFGYGVVYAADMSFSDFEEVFVIEDNEALISWNIPAIVSFIIGFFLLILFSFAYFIKLNRHNKHNPHNQLPTLLS